MSRPKRKYRKNSDRRIWVRGERHDPPDVRRLSRALLDLAAEMAAAQAETEARAAHDRGHRENVEARPPMEERS